MVRLAFITLLAVVARSSGSACDIDFALEYTTDGACPAGWTCTGEAQCWDGTQVGPSSSYAGGYTGNGYLVVGADGDMGTATSDPFFLDSSVSTVEFARCGGADSPCTGSASSRFASSSR